MISFRLGFASAAGTVPVFSSCERVQFGHFGGVRARGDEEFGRVLGASGEGFEERDGVLSLVCSFRWG